MACSWSGSRERIWLPSRESTAGLGAGFTRAWPAPYGLDEAELARIGAGEGWIDGMGCSSVYCWIEVVIQGASGSVT
ncbi:hypothetical protein M0R45_008136 [Rubus argutus]|uniref:Uncharacterized protein n=1 Tax=Rubus argutus TaxID=59490 RepID=A0AAW1Y0Q5_RUBAR